MKARLKQRMLRLIQHRLDLIPDVNRAVERRVDAELERIAGSGQPIVVGPWLSEVGFELLYWIPFLRRMSIDYEIDPTRLTALSRGGVRDWYTGVANGYAEVFDLVTPDEYREGNLDRIARAGGQKHVARSSLDEQLLSRLAETSFGHEFEVVHPALMYELLMPYWAGIRPLSAVLRRCEYAPLTRVSAAVPMELPETYVAAKFYFSDGFPDSAQNRAAGRDLLEAVSRRAPVVSLDTGLQIDDHWDFRPPSDSVLSMPSGLSPADNLAVQTAVVQGALGFVGTYGGFSYLAPLLGVPALGLYSKEDRFVRYHLEVADRMGAVLRAQPFKLQQASLTIVPVDVVTAVAARFATSNLEVQ